MRERGSRLVLADHPQAAERLAEVVEECLALGGEAVGAAFDGHRRSCGRLGNREPWAVLRASSTAPGLQGEFVSVERYPLEDARRLLDVNVLGLVCVLAAAARAMIHAGSGGSIVNIASMAGVSGAPNMPAYSASKAAVVGLSKAAAKDLAPHGIRVNAVSPAFIGPRPDVGDAGCAQAEAGSQYFADDPDTVASQMIAHDPAPALRDAEGGRSGCRLPSLRRSLVCHRRQSRGLGRKRLMTIRVAQSNLDAIAAEGIAVPRYDRSVLAPRILHLGVGGFHRSHMALYTDELATDGSDWAIRGVGLFEADRPMADEPRAAKTTSTR